MNNCRICYAHLSKKFVAKEMMLGFREEFEYGVCSSCGTIQILSLPDSIIEYYPPYYYSFKQHPPKLKPLSFLKGLVKDLKIRKKYLTSKRAIIKCLKPLATLTSENILDIGCGSGQLICELFNLGFTNVQGVDKFISNELDYGNGVKVFKKDLSELKKESYDLLMMHHVFEHMDEPLQELQKSYALLKKGGHLIIRIPVVGKAWEIYQENWAQLDAPRHFFIHTEASMKLLADQAGFNITNVIYDSGSFQFWGSELYKQDIALVDDKTKEYRAPGDFFSEETLADYEIQAKQLNKDRQGDQAIFYLKK